jgi:hypothetical protein
MKLFGTYCDVKELAAQWNHLHQPGEITQEFAYAVSDIPGVTLLKFGWLAEKYKLRVRMDSESYVTTIYQVLLILHAFGIEVDWPRTK